MNPAHLHLMVNHLPVLGTPFVLALLLWGLVRHSRDLLRAALGGAIVVAALSYPVFLTGEPAEERVEDASWLQERRVHEHEERAEGALIAMLLTGAVAMVGLWQSRGERPVSTGLAGLTAAGLLLSAGLFGWTALAGGTIRHDEIRDGGSGAVLAPVPGDTGQQGGVGDDDGDND